MPAFYNFLSSLYNCFFKIYFVYNITRGGAKVLRGGAENFRRGAKSFQGRCAPPLKIPPLLKQDEMKLK